MFLAQIGDPTGLVLNAVPWILAAVALGVAYAASRATLLPVAAGALLAGIGVAAAAGFLLADGLADLTIPGLVENVTGPAFAVAVFLVAASAMQVYALRRTQAEVGLWLVLGGLGLVGVAALADVKTAAFATGALLVVFGALKALQTNVLVHATIWLAAMLVGVSALYLSIGAEFLAAIQILIYVGAVITLFLFTVMLTVPDPESHLSGIEVPPGVEIESVVELEEATPRIGSGPYKSFNETNPRKPLRAPNTLYGVHIADGVYGDEKMDRRWKDKKEAKP